MADQPKDKSVVPPRMTIKAAAAHGMQKPPGQVMLPVVSPTELSPSSAYRTPLNPPSSFLEVIKKYCQLLHQSPVSTAGNGPTRP